MRFLSESFLSDTAPTAQQLRAARTRSLLTQGRVASVLGVSERQYQRWEAEGGMPTAEWRRFTMIWGHRFPDDFVDRPGAMSRGWNPDRARPRDTIENGDWVHLQPINGPMIQARLLLDLTQESRAQEGTFAGHVVDFPGQPSAGPAFGGFYIGERVTFAARNIIHVEQASPMHVAACELAPKAEGAVERGPVASLERDGS